MVCRPILRVEPSLPSARPGDISWMATTLAPLSTISCATSSLRTCQWRLSLRALAVRTLNVATRIRVPWLFAASPWASRPAGTGRTGIGVGVALDVHGDQPVVEMPSGAGGGTGSQGIVPS